MREEIPKSAITQDYLNKESRVPLYAIMSSKKFPLGVVALQDTQLAFAVTDSVRNGFQRARIIIVLDTGISKEGIQVLCKLLTLPIANYDGAHAFNIQLLIAKQAAL